MSSTFRWFRGIAASLLGSALAAGCADAPHDELAPGNGRMEELTLDEPGTVLFELKTAEGDWVAFHEFEDGSIASVGRLSEHADPALRRSLEEASRGGDLATLYRALTKGQPDRETLAKLAASDALSADPLSQPAQLAQGPGPSELGAKQDLASFGASLVPRIETRQSSAECFQSDTFYIRESDGWTRTNCVTTDGLPNVFCRTNQDDQILYDYHRARRFRATVLNQTRCNQASFACKYKYTDWTWTGPRLVSRQFLTADVGPREQHFCTWNTSRDDVDFAAVIQDVSGPERGHLCMAVNKAR